MPLAGRAQLEIAADRRLGTQDWPDPAFFSYNVIEVYLRAAGDFVHGLHLVSDPQWDLGFSSGTLARSACEYANRCWWLADPEIAVEKRVARALAVWQNTVSEERQLMDGGNLGVISDLGERINEWKRGHAFGIIDPLPGPTRLFELMYGQEGVRQYKRLCNSSHGSLLTVLRDYHAITCRPQDAAVDVWWRVLIATRHALNAATRVSDLRGGAAPESLRDVFALRQYYSHWFDAWVRLSAGFST